MTNKMTATKRRSMMSQFAAIAKQQEARGDMPLARQAARNWREIATSAEEAKAPRYLRRWF
jgi:uncharacterized protein YycO